uniref:Integrator complex subunit 11 n=1 Tax=Arcella intermedia TaxID=1963864 RepID=A0A6B2KZ25_9EUKA|eukprot:TRINITY_DN2042_c0_g1_i1.p1 TRINITY_DN2042_c0_g1~~TRINITY_DN2042_c0_g1_i1.p1  ORF type:complete len:678 (+),score=116.17 TRINITY_DN2042_c0_g1_i1:23-2056(+)
MSQIKVVPLGAGQDVGRSCILVSIGGKNIMFDCGMHAGYSDERRFPDFSYISRSGKFDEVLDAVIISHFHLDHCGALPFFTEMCGYNGPIFMTYPTKAICPILLEDYRKISTERKGETNFFTTQMIKDCMKKVTAVNVHEVVKVDDELEIKAYYAGHVLGAAMFLVRVGGETYNLSALYTGDYNMTPDRHLGSASVDEKIRPDLLITETTYAVTIRDSKRTREGNFLKRIHKTVAAGGKVLIPVFALGRAQELCILIDSYWERMNLNIPIYFSAGLTERANMYYELFINWTNEKIKSTFVNRNMFDFKHIKPFPDKALLDRPGPMVLFATPGMLHAGTSLEAFKKWCGSELNMCILPGFCVMGTVGSKVLSGQKMIDVDKNTKIQVRCKIESLSFSAHADSKGILQLIKQTEPRNVMLVHGEKGKMQILKANIVKDTGIPVYDPANGEIVNINITPQIPADLSIKLLKRQFFTNEPFEPSKKSRLFTNQPIEGILVMSNSIGAVQILDPVEVSNTIGLNPHKLTYEATFHFPAECDAYALLNETLKSEFPQLKPDKLLQFNKSGRLDHGSIHLTVNNTKNEVLVAWDFTDDDKITQFMEKLETRKTDKLMVLETSNVPLAQIPPPEKVLSSSQTQIPPPSTESTAWNWSRSQQQNPTQSPNPPNPPNTQKQSEKEKL